MFVPTNFRALWLREILTFSCGFIFTHLHVRTNILRTQNQLIEKPAKSFVKKIFLYYVFFTIFNIFAFLCEFARKIIRKYEYNITVHIPFLNNNNNNNSTQPTHTVTTPAKKWQLRNSLIDFVLKSYLWVYESFHCFHFFVLKQKKGGVLRHSKCCSNWNKNTIILLLGIIYLLHLYCSCNIAEIFQKSNYYETRRTLIEQKCNIAVLFQL